MKKIILAFLLSFPFLAFANPASSLNDISGINNDIYLQNSILMGAVGNKGVITILSDHHCPHCQELYSHINQVIGAGYTLQFGILPITGKSMDEYKRIACSSNPIFNFNKAYTDKTFVIPNSSCDLDLTAHTKLAAKYKATGTPFIIFNGQTISGFSNLNDFLKWLSTNTPSK